MLYLGSLIPAIELTRLQIAQVCHNSDARADQDSK